MENNIEHLIMDTAYNVERLLKSNLDGIGAEEIKELYSMAKNSELIIKKIVARSS